MKLRTTLLRCVALGLFGWVLNAPQALSQITLTCNPADTLVECPDLPAGGMECHNCHPIQFPTANTSCTQGGLSVTFMGSEVIAPPPPDVPFAIPMDTVLTSGDFAYTTMGFGTIQLYFKATDSCGNTATCSYDFTNIPIVPVMDFSYCPDNITVLAPIGQSHAVVTFDPPVYESNCFPYALSQVEGALSGNPFPYGVTAIKWAAAHVLGTDFCDFTVTVLPPGSNADTLCQREYFIPADDVICVNTTATDGLSVVATHEGAFMRHEISATGILLGSIPLTVDSSNVGVFQVVPLNVGALNATTQILRFASDGSVAYIIEIEGTVSAFFRSPCEGDLTFIFRSAITGAAMQKFTHEIRLGPTEASILYRCEEFIPPPSISGIYYTTTSWTLLPDGGKINFSLRNVTSSNSPLSLPLGRTSRVWRTNSSETMLWETALNPALPAVHCMRVLERPGQNFVLAGAALPDGQLWTYRSDCLTPVSSTSESAETMKMQISPNPTRGTFRLDVTPELAGHTGLLLEVYDMYGRRMYRQSLNAVSQQMVSLPEGLANGCYVLHLRLPDDNSAMVRRIVLLR